MADSIVTLLLALLPHTFLGQVDFDPNEKDECPTAANSAYRWNTERNRCVLKKDSSRGREAFRKCQAIEDLEKRKKCLEANRDDLSGADTVTLEDPLDGRLSTITASIPAVFFVVGMVNKKAAGENASCISKKIFRYSSIAGMALEVYFRLLAKRKFNRLAKEYEKMKEEDPYKMQVAAFKFLEEQQGEIATIAGRQSRFYKILATAYVSSAALGTLESASVLGLKPCVAGSKGVGGKGLGRLLNLTGHSPGIAILSGVMTGLYIVLARAADEDKKTAEERKEKLQQIREQFENMYATAGFCPSRTDMEKPHCYCYTDDGERNPLRTRSEVCQKVWAFHDRDLFVPPNNRTLGPGESPPPREGCMDANGDFDLDCRCLRIVDESGENSCYKEIISSDALANLPSEAGTAETLANLSELTSGGLGNEATGGDVNKRPPLRPSGSKKFLKSKMRSTRRRVFLLSRRF